MTTLEEPRIPSTATELQHEPSKPPAPTGHPLDPLTPDEITNIALSLRMHIATKTEINAIKFVIAHLVPPPKRAVLAHLGIPVIPGGMPEPKSDIIRRADVDFIDVVTGQSYNTLLSLKEGKWTVESFSNLGVEIHPAITVDELLACEHIIRQDERVIKYAKDVGIEPDQLFADGWSIGYDHRFPNTVRVQQALLFARISRHDNAYAHPMDFVPVLDANTKKVIHIDFPSYYKQSASSGEHTLGVDTTEPPLLSLDQFQASNRERIPPPLKPHDFLPDLMKEADPAFKLRDDVKPLHVVQPEGVSFTMNGNELEWQKWKMHVGFSHREGIALSTITYNDDGVVRPVMYRLSLAEMVVPYGAPEHPHPRKVAFDIGEYGVGTVANELSLGCDCLGQIHYLPGCYIAHDGSAVVVKNAICIHEEDAGILWKHTDFRPGGRARTVRSRRLVVSMVCTLSNYEYVWNYYFYQHGQIELEIRLTGILQVYVHNPQHASPFGTIVAPNINAHNHQHLFCLRVDPMIDGLNNSVIETDILPLPNAPTGSKLNYAGNAFIAQDTVLKHASQGGRDYDHSRDRRWKIVNPARQHPSSGHDVGYSITMKGGITPLMARPDGWAAKRAVFTSKPIWVVQDKEDEQGGRMWPAGKYVPQTRVEPENSVGGWVKKEESIESEDLVVFLTVGTTHIPRPEDWPVMPAEHVNVMFKPSSFFTTNPSMDVPGTNDAESAPAFS